MKILVAGGAGFIGGHLCEALLEKGHGVTAVDNLSNGRVSNIARLLKNRKFDFIKADILDGKKIGGICAGSDLVFHLAANSDIAKSHGDPDVDYNATFRTTYALLNAMRAHGVKKICFASSSAVYGELPGKLSESAGPLRPVSHYGAAKLASEAFISSFAENYGFTAWIIRFPNVVGELATHGVIYDFIAKLRKNPAKLEILGDGKQRKPYMYAGDLVKAMLHIIKTPGERINIYNVGVEGLTSVDFIAARTAAEMGLAPKLVYTGGRTGWPGDVPSFAYDYSKLLRTGWKPQFTSDQAVKYALKKMLNKP